MKSLFKGLNIYIYDLILLPNCLSRSTHSLREHPVFSAPENISSADETGAEKTACSRRLFDPLIMLIVKGSSQSEI